MTAPRRPERTGLPRLIAAGRNLAAEQRAVLLAAGVLLLTMLLPWYSTTITGNVGGKLGQVAGGGKLAITVFSFVEAAIFLVAVGVTLLILARGDRRPFHLPGGDGIIVTIAGAWATFLIFYRFVDKPSGTQTTQTATEYGLSWGIFFGLLAALALLVAGLRLRAAQLAEPAFPGTIAPSDGPDGSPVPAPRRRATPDAGPEPLGTPGSELPTHHTAPRPDARGGPRARALPTDAATRVSEAAEETTVMRVARTTDPEEAERAARRRDREARRRGARGVAPPDPEPEALAPDEPATEVRARRDPDSFEPREFDRPPRPRRRD